MFIYSTNNSDPWQCLILDFRCAWVNSDLIKLKILCVLMDTKKLCTPLFKLNRTGEVLFISVTSRRIFFIGLVYPTNHLIMCFLENDLHNSIWKHRNEWSSNTLVVWSLCSYKSVASLASVPLFVLCLQLQTFNNDILWERHWHSLSNDTVFSAKINSDKEIEACLVEMLCATQSQRCTQLTESKPVDSSADSPSQNPKSPRTRRAPKNIAHITWYTQGAKRRRSKQNLQE